MEVYADSMHTEEGQEKLASGGKPSICMSFSWAKSLMKQRTSCTSEFKPCHKHLPLMPGYYRNTPIYQEVSEMRINTG